VNPPVATWAIPFTVEQVAQMLGCAAYTVRTRAREGDLPGLKFGDDWVFPPEALTVRLTEMALEEATARRVKPASFAVAVGVHRCKRRTQLPLALLSVSTSLS